MTWREGSPFGGLLAGAAGLLAVHAFLSVTLGVGYAIPTTILGVIGTTVVLRGPLGQAIARRLHGADPTTLPPDQVLGELDELRGRITELEERADFAERLLARQKDPERVGGDE